jgi:hypothetical protein
MQQEHDPRGEQDGGDHHETGDEPIAHLVVGAHVVASSSLTSITSQQRLRQ